MRQIKKLNLKVEMRKCTQIFLKVGSQLFFKREGAWKIELEDNRAYAAMAFFTTAIV